MPDVISEMPSVLSQRDAQKPETRQPLTQHLLISIRCSVIQWGGVGWSRQRQASSSSEPALQPRTALAFGSSLCRAEHLGFTAFNAKQGPRLRWQLRHQLVFCPDTLLLAIGGKCPAPFLVCYCQKPICSSHCVGSVGCLVTVSLEL